MTFKNEKMQVPVKNTMMPYIHSHKINFICLHLSFLPAHAVFPLNGIHLISDKLCAPSLSLSGVRDLILFPGRCSLRRPVNGYSMNTFNI